jgi:hypothetical protein
VTPEVLARFNEKVEKHPGGCWRWRGATDGKAYPQLRLHGATRRAHRLAYEHFVGPIPPGFTLDHVCHNRDAACAGGPNCCHRSCVNPNHLEPTTVGENLRRARASRSTARRPRRRSLLLRPGGETVALRRILLAREAPG